MTTTSTTGSVGKAKAARPPFRQESAGAAAWRRYRQNPLAVIGLIVFGLLVFSAVFGNMLVPYDPYKPAFAEVLQQPSAKHLLGTDAIGRDLLSRILLAGRYSLLVGISVQIMALVIGLPLGAIAGWKGGRTDYFIMRLIDIVGSFPMLLLQMVLVTIMGILIKPGPWIVIIALSVTGWLGYCWLIRSQVLSLREREYVLAAHSFGATSWHVIRKHLIPNALGPIIVSISFGIPGTIGAEAGLSFLGLGITPPTPTWGQMLGDGGNYIQTPSTWYLIIPPAVIMAVVLLSFQFMGDGLRQAITPGEARK